MQWLEFTMLLGGAAAWPLAASAQQPVIVVLIRESFNAYEPFVRAFKRSLSEKKSEH